MTCLKHVFCLFVCGHFSFLKLTGICEELYNIVLLLGYTYAGAMVTPIVDTLRRVKPILSTKGTLNNDLPTVLISEKRTLSTKDKVCGLMQSMCTLFWGSTAL